MRECVVEPVNEGVFVWPVGHLHKLLLDCDDERLMAEGGLRCKLLRLASVSDPSNASSESTSSLPA